jgi:hypothetical protein
LEFHLGLWRIEKDDKPTCRESEPTDFEKRLYRWSDPWLLQCDPGSQEAARPISVTFVPSGSLQFTMQMSSAMQELLN